MQSVRRLGNPRASELEAFVGVPERSPGSVSGEWKEGHHHEHRTLKDHRVVQLVCLGTGFAIIGLIFSLSAIIFRSQCSMSHTKGMFRQGANGAWEMCKDMGYTRLDSGYAHSLHGREWTNASSGTVLPIIGTTCHADADCANVDIGGDWFTQQASCIGGPPEKEGLWENGYCATADCTCHMALFSCGVSGVVPFKFRPARFVDNCHPHPKCNLDFEIYVQMWSVHEGLGGCERPHRATVLDVMKKAQKEIEEIGLQRALKPETDPAWDTIRMQLSETPDVKFGNFWPSTISESVSNNSSCEAKIFIGFMLIASLCLFSSNYPSFFKTVDMPGVTVGGFWLINTIRSLLPPIGLLLLAMVPMKPTSNIVNVVDYLMTACHLCGAQLCFVVYLLCEFWSLYDKHNRKEMGKGEFGIRLTITIIGASCMAIFVVVYGILQVFAGSFKNPFVDPPFTGNSDMFETVENFDAVLIRPARGTWKVMKFFSYFAEYIVAMCILISHGVIAHFEYQRTRAGLHIDEENDEGNSDADTDPE